MSELRIGLVAEGPTDYEIVQAALKACLPGAFVMTLLQPETTQPEMGAGWGGVLKWCHDARRRHSGPLETDPTLIGFDLLILHLDADVAEKRYADCGTEVESMVQDWSWETLPCVQPCPPAADTCARLEVVLDRWLGQAGPGERTLYCVPAQASDTWLAAAVLPSGHALLSGALECKSNVESMLKQLPKSQRIKKTVREYRQHAPTLTAHWPAVKRHCTQAQVFEQAVQSALAPPPGDQ